MDASFTIGVYQLSFSDNENLLESSLSAFPDKHKHKNCSFVPGLQVPCGTVVLSHLSEEGGVLPSFNPCYHHAALIGQELK